MSISHGVVPAEQALKCEDCHFYGKRLNWKALGYPGDPILTGVTRFEVSEEKRPTTTSNKVQPTPGFEVVAGIAAICLYLVLKRKN